MKKIYKQDPAYHRSYYLKNRERLLAKNRQWQLDNPERTAWLSRNAHCIKKYGVSTTDYDRILAEQGGQCAICKQAPKGRKLHIDHCHNSRAVRGLLCHGCNIGIGHFRDSPELLYQAATYLTPQLQILAA